MVAIRNYNYKTNKIPDLTGWIGKVKKKLQRQKHKNLRLEVILANTLNVAQYELRQKQLERKVKWINMKRAMDENVCGNLNDHQPEIQYYDRDNSEDILNLDKFMLQLKTITKPVNR